MPTATSDTIPYWSTSATFPQYAKLADDAQADVVVVDAGITSLTAAYVLAQAGTRIILRAAIAKIDDIVREHSIDAGSELDEFCDDPRGVKTNGHTVTCEDVVIATHNPSHGA